MAIMSVNRVGVLSFAKITGIVGAGIGLIIGVIYGLIVMTIGAALMSGRGGPGAGAGIVGGLFVMILVPAFYGILSFVFGALYAFIYNVAAGFVGGIELEMTEVGVGFSAPPPPQQPWTQPNPYQQPGQQQPPPPPYYGQR
jgi:hypothetical protein